MLQDTGQLDDALSQDAHIDTRDIMQLRDYMKDHVLSRLLQDKPDLENTAAALRSGANVDVRPLTSVLEFLRKSMAYQTYLEPR